MELNLPTPDEYVRMPWHARRRLQERMRRDETERLSRPEPTTPKPLTPEVAADMDAIIGLLNKMLDDDYAAKRRHR